jgi:translation initiation factor 1
MAGKKNEWKNREGVVYSTDPSFTYTTPHAGGSSARPAREQKLIVGIDRSGRNGKQVTVVEGFIGGADDLDSLARRLKSKCATGGSVKEGAILIQGDFRDRVADFLSKEGYGVKRRN